VKYCARSVASSDATLLFTAAAPAGEAGSADAVAAPNVNTAATAAAATVPRRGNDLDLDMTGSFLR
jgi:hypothetical protein